MWTSWRRCSSLQSRAAKMQESPRLESSFQNARNHYHYSYNNKKKNSNRSSSTILCLNQNDWLKCNHHNSIISYFIFSIQILFTYLFKCMSKPQRDDSQSRMSGTSLHLKVIYGSLKWVPYSMASFSRSEAFSCSVFQASSTCLSSVNGAPTANRSMYLSDRT